MMNQETKQSVSQEILADIALLVNVARVEIEAADKDGDPHLFNDASLKYGYIAHRVYLALDTPHRDCTYHNEVANRVLLDPWTVFNRANSYGIRNTGITPDSPEFWNHADMIKSLTDYFLQVRQQKEDHASA